MVYNIVSAPTLELSRDGIASLRVFDITPLTRAPGPCSVTASSITSMMARITTSSCQVFIENTLFAHFFNFFLILNFIKILCNQARNSRKSKNRRHVRYQHKNI